jgi:hypothetical protein
MEEGVWEIVVGFWLKDTEQRIDKFYFFNLKFPDVLTARFNKNKIAYNVLIRNKTLQ